MVEGWHSGHAVIVDRDGTIARAWGHPGAVIYPRSSNKPMQAAAMVRAGLDLPDRLLALSGASHSGEAMHLSGVDDILALAGSNVAQLQTPPDFPLDPVERDAWIRDGRGQIPAAMNCSGKHAAMIMVCTQQGWDTQSYRDPDHPLQQAIRAEVESATGEPVAHIGVDGCGAPVMAVTLAGLARGLSALVQQEPGQPGRRVADAMRSHPERVGGSRREVTMLMTAVPGLLAKDGADGVYAGALGDGRAFALKVLDGSERARTVAMAAVLTTMGFGEAVAQWSSIDVLGHGKPVGRIRSPLA